MPYRPGMTGANASGPTAPSPSTITARDRRQLQEPDHAGLAGELAGAVPGRLEDRVDHDPQGAPAAIDATEPCGLRWPPGSPHRRALLDGPAVAVRVAEEEERVPVVALAVREARAVVVPDGRDRDAPAGEERVGGVDVRHAQLEALEGPRRHLRQSRSDRDRASRALRRHLDDPEVLVGRMVDVDREPHLVRVEGLGPVHVGHGDDDDLELELHVWLLGLWGTVIRRPGGRAARPAARTLRRRRPPSHSRSSRRGPPRTGGPRSSG